MTSIKKAGLAIILTTTLLIVPQTSSWAFRNIAVGDVLPNATLKSLNRIKKQVVKTGTKANVFLFVRPGQAQSEGALVTLSDICKSKPAHSINCVAVFSDFHSKKTVAKLARRTGWSKDHVLIDEGDLYYGKIGVYVHPSCGVVDGSGKLLAYVPYSGTHSISVIRAQIRFALGEIDEAELKNAIRPTSTKPANAKDRALTRYHYARKLFRDGKLEEALKQTRKSISLDERLAEAYGLMGRIYGTKKRCDKARPYIEKSLALSQDNAEARKALQMCP